MSDPLDNPDFDLDEDLFDFAKVAADADDEVDSSEEDLADVLASFREAPEAEEAPADEDLADLVEPVAAARGPEPEPVPEPVAPRPVAAAPQTAPAPRKVAAATVAAESAAPPAAQAATVVPAAAPARVSRGLVAIAISVTVLNSVLAIVFLRRLPGSHEEVRADGATQTSHEAPHEPPPEPVATEDHQLPDPDLSGRVHGHPALDEAREELARGDYAACRQHAYALLSVIDRYEDPRREEIEAECQYLIAQSLHLEALARLGRSE